MMNIPKPAGVEVLVQTYYENPWLFNADIKTIFPGASNDTVVRLKNLAREKADEMGMMQYNDRSVLTKPAHRVGAGHRGFGKTPE